MIRLVTGVVPFVVVRRHSSDFWCGSILIETTNGIGVDTRLVQIFHSTGSSRPSSWKQGLGFVFEFCLCGLLQQLAPGRQDPWRLRYCYFLMNRIRSCVISLQNTQVHKRLHKSVSRDTLFTFGWPIALTCCYSDKDGYLILLPYKY